MTFICRRFPKDGSVLKKWGRTELLTNIGLKKVDTTLADLEQQRLVLFMKDLVQAQFELEVVSNDVLVDANIELLAEQRVVIKVMVGVRGNGSVSGAEDFRDSA